MSVMGIIGCSVLSNELAYLIRRDPEVNKATVVDNPEGCRAAEKMAKARACETVEVSPWEHVRLGPGGDDEVLVWVNPSDLHDSQERTRATLTEEATLMAGSVDAILMLYGQCRCQTLDVRALQSELGVPIIFLTDRTNAVVDDCVAATLGGSRQYLELIRQKGMLFVTPGYVEERVRQQRGTGLAKVLEQVEQLQALFDYMGYKGVLKMDNQLDWYGDFDEIIDMFARTFGLYVRTLLCNQAVFEDSYDWAKSSMRAHARGGQLAGSSVSVRG